MLHMDSFFFFLSPSFFLIIFLLVFLQVASAEDDIQYTNCSPFDCGKLGNISYPFWTDNLGRPAYCGYVDERYKLKCVTDQFPVITISSQEFLLVGLNQSRSLMTIKRRPLDQSGKYINCPKAIPMDMVFSYSNTAVNITLSYGCRSRASANHNFTCKLADGREDFALFFEENNGEECDTRKVEIPVGKEALNELILGKATLNETLVQSFDMRYVAYDGYCKQCNQSGGRCGTNANSSQVFTCYCSDRPYPFTCELHGIKNGFNLAFGLAIGGISLLIIISIITIYFKRKTLYLRTRGLLGKFSKIDRDIEAFLKINGTLALKRYSYSDIRKMTNSFKEKLGKGGHGSVYKGKLQDGHLVAVKLLDASKENGQEFINEVASISRTSHVNVVTLLGFCLEGQKRALIYEFMPNGSLERFIYKENTTNLKNRQQLASEELYRVAIGIARGLEYLHRGCNTRIVHFDIKPHNILLDENFCPKISDFGLAKLCTRKESFVSMMEARGTIGYIAPEVFCRSVGGVSHKSDVYSYGMMILEMVGGRRNIDDGVSQTSEIYFPHWIDKQLEEGSIELKLLGLRTIEESEIARKMIMVGLWCIQTNPPDRPSMSKVIEMLEGSIEALQIPPRPYLSSPPRSPVDSSS